MGKGGKAMRKGMFTFFGGLVLSALLRFGAMAQQADWVIYLAMPTLEWKG